MAARRNVISAKVSAATAAACAAAAKAAGMSTSAWLAGVLERETGVRSAYPGGVQHRAQDYDMSTTTNGASAPRTAAEWQREASLRRQALAEHAPPPPDADDIDRGEWRSANQALRARVAEAECEWRESDEREALSGGAWLPGPRAVPGEVREYLDLQARCTTGKALYAIVAGDAVAGAEEELRAAEGMPADRLSMTYLDPGEQHRADAVSSAPSDIQAAQERILARVLGDSVAMSEMGVSSRAVPVGDHIYPLVTAGTAPAFRARGAKADATAMTITTHSVEPQRITASYHVHTQDLFRVRDLETTLRADLRIAVLDAIDKQIIGLGDSRIRGFLATSANGGVADLAATTEVVDFAKSVAQYARAVDGLHARTEKDCCLIVRPEVHRKLATLFQTNDALSSVALANNLFMRYTATTHLPAPAASVSTGLIARRGPGSGDGMNAVMPVWYGARIVRDEVTGVQSGILKVTIEMYLSFVLVRPAAYARTTWKTA